MAVLNFQMGAGCEHYIGRDTAKKQKGINCLAAKLVTNLCSNFIYIFLGPLHTWAKEGGSVSTTTTHYNFFVVAMTSSLVTKPFYHHPLTQSLPNAHL